MLTGLFIALAITECDSESGVTVNGVTAEDVHDGSMILVSVSIQSSLSNKPYIFKDTESLMTTPRTTTKRRNR